jgi:hypothetical protein
VIDGAARSPWLDPSQWVRLTRGKTWTFFAPTEVLAEAIQRVAQELGDQFELLACLRVTVDNRSRSTFVVESVADLTKATSRQYFIRSKAFTPNLPAPRTVNGVGWPAAFAVNGLVLLNHPISARGATIVSSIGIATRVENSSSHDVIRHGEYEELFQRLRKEILGSGGIERPIST